MIGIIQYLALNNNEIQNGEQTHKGRSGIRRRRMKPPDCDCWVGNIGFWPHKQTLQSFRGF